MRQLYERVEEFYRAFSATAGPFVLFGLFEREEALGLWDLVVSAEWLTDRSKEDSRRLQEKLFQELQAHLGPEILSLSRVALLDPRQEFVRALDGIRVRGGILRNDAPIRVEGILSPADRWVEIRDCALNGMQFRRIVLFEYDPDLIEAEKQATPAVLAAG